MYNIKEKHFSKGYNSKLEVIGVNNFLLLTYSYNILNTDLQIKLINSIKISSVTWCIFCRA